MIRYERSKSSVFLLEILINILLFCILCVCSLQFFIKSYQLTNKTTNLHHAVTLCNSVAAAFQSGDGSLNAVKNVFDSSFTSGDSLYIYLDKNYQECDSRDVAYYITVSPQHTSIPSVEISFYENGYDSTYCIEVYHYQPLTPVIINATGGTTHE